MKKVLVEKSNLPLSMSAPLPCASKFYAQPLPILMLDVLFEDDYVVLLRDTITREVYTCTSVEMKEPTEQELTVYFQLGRMYHTGITDLNIHHYDTLMSLTSRLVFGGPADEVVISV